MNNNRFEGYDMEYIKKTWNCLRGLPDWKRRGAIMEADIEDLQERIKESAVPRTSHISPGGGGGHGNASSTVEDAIERREDMEAELRRKRQQLHELEFQISRIERGLNHLPADERDVVTAKYINRLSWEKTAASLFMSINLCYRLADRATETLAIMLYGPDACPAMFPDDLFIM